MRPRRSTTPSLAEAQALLAFCLAALRGRGAGLPDSARAVILALVVQKPGLTLQQVFPVVGVARATAWHHLHRLESEEAVVSISVRRRRHYFAAGTLAALHRSELSVLSAPIAHRIATEVLARPGAAQEDLCGALALHQSAASKQLHKLEAAGLVRTSQAGHRRRYVPTVLLHQLEPCFDLPWGSDPDAGSRPRQPG